MPVFYCGVDDEHISHSAVYISHFQVVPRAVFHGFVVVKDADVPPTEECKVHDGGTPLLVGFAFFVVVEAQDGLQSIGEGVAFELGLLRWCPRHPLVVARGT